MGPDGNGAHVPAMPGRTEKRMGPDNQGKLGGPADMASACECTPTIPLDYDISTRTCVSYVHAYGMCDVCIAAKTEGGWERGRRSMTADYSEVEWYLEYLRAHGRRETTIESAGNALRHLMDILAEGGRPTVMEAVTLDDAEWLAKQLDDIKESTKAEYIRLFSRMSIQLGCQDWGKRLDILYNREEPDRVWISLDQYAVLHRKAEPWDRMMLVLGAFMGLRRMEICSLLDEQIDIDARKMTVFGKGHGKGLRVVMDIPEPVVEEIESFREYKNNHLKRNEEDGHLVQVPRWGTWVPIEPVTASQRIKSLGERCHIKVTPHALRRLYATTLVNVVEADLDTVRRLMRHSDISTTVRCYVAADPSKMTTAQSGLMSVYGRVLSSV